MKMVFGTIKGPRTQRLMWKIPFKGYCMILEKMKNFIFNFFYENLLSAWFKDEHPQGLSGKVH